jgi:predicted esterase
VNAVEGGIVVDSCAYIWQLGAMFRHRGPNLGVAALWSPWSNLWLGLGLCLWVNIAVASPSTPNQTVQVEQPAPESAHWCAPELTPLSDTVCYYSPSSESAEGKTNTLVIFLHSLVSAAPKAAWEQQLRMRRLADTYRFTILIPRGRPGLGPGRDVNTLAWPTAEKLQREHEAELHEEWNAAIERAEGLHGTFARRFVIGFSNGAYYATSLAFREAFICDGFALFAGGSGSKYHRLAAAKAKRRTPMFVGFGTLDPDNPQQRALVTLLKQLGWPHHSLAAKVGHTVAAEQLRAALRFLGHPGVADK